MKFIPLTKGLQAIVDDDDFPRLSQFKWFARVSHHKRGLTWHAARHERGNNGSMVWMHHEVLGVKTRTDHKNRDGLDNRRQNLRPATPILNSFNVTKYRTRNGRPTSSRYKGVHWATGPKKWIAKITVNKRIVQLGSFDDELVAARTYDQAALKHAGEFAVLNFPEERSNV